MSTVVSSQFLQYETGTKFYLGIVYNLVFYTEKALKYITTVKVACVIEIPSVYTHKKSKERHFFQAKQVLF